MLLQYQPQQVLVLILYSQADNFYNSKIFLMQCQQGDNPGHNIYRGQIKKDGPLITLRSNFDSGNMGKVQIGINTIIIITPASDCAGTQWESHAKGWFYFAAKGFPLHNKQKFVIKKMNQLSCSKFSEYFKPVYKYQGQQWERIQTAITFTKDQETQLHFEFKFQKNLQVSFAYSYPFGFDQCERLLKNYSIEMRSQKTIYYKDQIMIHTVQGRPLHLLTITSHQDKQNFKQSIINENLFQNNQNKRPFKFESKKKVILITGRVHPGETPSSHTLNGILKFLLSKDARAYILRKNFVFNIIPMLNPDGVYHGHYRMDTLNQNLNRYYLKPDRIKQPSAFAVRSLGCYIDLHAHPQKKGNFIYGNSLDTHEQQIQTQLFAKILSLNCVEFDYQNSSFAKKQMNSKDKNDQLTKQGCGRVVFNKLLGQIYSYTIQCGYTSSIYYNQLTSITNIHRKYQKYGIISDEIQNIKSGYYNKKYPYFTIRTYQNLGKNLMVSLLDLFQKNPFSRIASTIYKDLNGIRKQISSQLCKINKDYKIYGQNLITQLKPQIKRKFDRTGLSGPKKLLTKKILIKTDINEKNRNKTLPKMILYK